MRHRLVAGVVVVALLAAAASTPAGGTRAAAQEQVLFSEFSNFALLRERPVSIHGGSDFGWVDITWASFGEATAQGSGFYYLDDKSRVPFVRNRYPVRLTLSEVRRCLSVLYYSRMMTAFTGADPAGAMGTVATIDYPCPIAQYTIRARGSSRGFGRVQAIGDFKPASDATLGAATTAFGEPTSRRSFREACTVRWAPLGVTILFANFGVESPCREDVGLAQSATISGRLWQTAKGLQAGDAVSKLRRLYPAARRFGNSWRLVSAVTLIGDRRRYSVLGATVRGGRVRAFSLFIGAAGD